MERQTQSESVPPAQAGKQKRPAGLLLLVLTVFAVAVAARWRHDHRAGPIQQDDDGAAQSALTAKIARLVPTERLPALLKALQDPDPEVRIAAIDSLADLHTTEAVNAVEAAFLDSASLVRETAVETLPKMDRERGLQLELAAFQDDDTWIREAIAGHYSTPGHDSPIDRRALPTLIHALDDTSPVVSTLAIRILHHVTGKNWTVVSTTPPKTRLAVIRQWKQWWESAAKTEHIPAEFTAIAARHSTRTDPAPDFQLTDTAGHTADLESERGKVILLNFWGTWCPPCRQEVPDLIRLDAAYRDKGVEIIGAALSEENGVNGLRQRCATAGILYRQTIAPDEMLDAYGHIHEVPISVLIDRKGRICGRWEGPRDYATFAAAIERAMKN